MHLAHGRQLSRVVILMKNMLKLLCFICCTAQAQSVIEVYDQHGAPVAGAVLSVSTEQVDTVDAPLATAVMDQVGVQFLPKVLVIRQGQLVSFPNSDSIRHHVYSFSAPKPFEIKLYSGTPTAPVLFDQAGLVVLGCNIHDKMVGYIYVAEPNELAWSSDEKGQAHINGQLPELVDIWHPRLSHVINDKQAVTVMADGPDKGKVVIELIAPIKTTTRTFKARFK